MTTWHQQAVLRHGDSVRSALDFRASVLAGICRGARQSPRGTCATARTVSAMARGKPFPAARAASNLSSSSGAVPKDCMLTASARSCPMRTCVEEAEGVKAGQRRSSSQLV